MIPEFSPGNVLPPFLGGDVVGVFHPRSPYKATMSELVSRFATSAERAKILGGLLALRAHLRSAGFSDGFQWIDGSFVENCELSKGRPPGDIDVVTLIFRPFGADEAGWDQMLHTHSETLFNAGWTKEQFLCDTYYVDLNSDPRAVAEQAAYWFGLFSHQRETFRWKGLVQLDFISDDSVAEAALAALESQW